MRCKLPYPNISSVILKVTFQNSKFKNEIPIVGPYYMTHPKHIGGKMGNWFIMANCYLPTYCSQPWTLQTLQNLQENVITQNLQHNQNVQHIKLLGVERGEKLNANIKKHKNKDNGDTSASKNI